MRKKTTQSSVCDTSPIPIYTLPSSPRHTLTTPPTVLTNLNLTYPQQTSSPVPFFHLLARLKTTPRAGWRRFGIPSPESIADHMYRMSIITMMAPASLTSTLDMAKCTRMALIHDMAESLVGDITPVDGVNKAEKSRRESETMDYICEKLLGGWSGGLNGKQVREIWQEYEDAKTKESEFVHDVDKIELLLQMVEYERSCGCETDLGEFTWVAGRIAGEEVKEWARQVFRERKELWEAKGKTCTWKVDMELQLKE